MTLIKSFSVGNGDMFYIKHASDNFSIIDCCLNDDNKEDIVNEIIEESKNKNITRFISTHPDEDHIQGLDYLDDNKKILNFYCVKNEATKEDETTSFERYCELRDSDESFFLYEGCSRKWMNQTDDDRGSAGINILWPEVTNEFYKDALEDAKNGESPNNISPIIKYSMNNGLAMIWMGDLETDFMNNIKDDLSLPKCAILVAPHHGRSSGKIPQELLNDLDPEIIIIGEAPSSNLNYYQNYNTITQNSAGDIIFDCETGKIHIYASNNNYSVNFLDDENKNTYSGYIGTLSLD